MKRIDYLEDQNGDLTKVLISDTKFETMHLSKGDDDPKLFCIVLTDEMVDAITQGWES
jgi:hypothetical protein